MASDMLRLRGTNGGQLEVSQEDERTMCIEVEYEGTRIPLYIDTVSAGQLWRFVQTLQGVMRP